MRNKGGCDGIGVVTTTDRKSNVLRVRRGFVTFFLTTKIIVERLLFVFHKKKRLLFVNDNSHTVTGCWKTVDYTNRLGLSLILYKLLGKCNALME